MALSTTYSIDTELTLENMRLEYKILAPLNTPRGDIHGVMFGRYGYIVGGFTHLNRFCSPLPSMEAYSLMTDKWLYLEDLHVARADASLVKFNGRFFAIGGEATYLNENAASCKIPEKHKMNANEDEGNDSQDNVDGRKKRLVARTFPVNSVEIFDPSNGLKATWKFAYSEFLPPDNQVFRQVSVPWTDTDSIYAFGGVMYQINEEEHTQFLKTSDHVLMLKDEFSNKHKFTKNSRTEIKFVNDNENPNSSWVKDGVMGFSSLGVVFLLIVGSITICCCRKVKKKKRKISQQKRRNYQYHTGDQNALDLVELKFDD